jgi:hypothetical protein
MDSDFIKQNQIPLVPLSDPTLVTLADGTTTISITHQTTPLKTQMNDHYEHLAFYVLPLSSSVILGHSWLQLHNPAIDWSSHTITFQSDHCLKNCVSTAITFSQVDLAPKKPNRRTQRFLSKIKTKIQGLFSINSQLTPFSDSDDDELTTPSKPASLPQVIWNKFYRVFSIPDDNHQLPDHASYDCEIVLDENATLPRAKIFQTTEQEAKCLKDYIDEFLRKGFPILQLDVSSSRKRMLYYVCVWITGG